ncbi:hypothetical protein QZH41_009442 [Actinostola sp. cb2023]|nr:hypothetical protein QZH41_009442 [Actinostola sp. cb2023]
MALAHELVMNENFEFQDFPDNSIEKHVKEIVHKAFWDRLREDLESTPPVYIHTLNLLVELKENLLGLLLPHHRSLRSQINGFLDVDLIKQQIEHDALDLKQYAQTVIDILANLCAPVRDDQVQGLLDVTGFVDIFREIFKVIDLMKMDMANFQIQALKPQLLQQSIEYERIKFKQYLETNPGLSMEGISVTTV